MQKEVHVEELADRFGVSALTVRRDLEHLTGEKTILRTYGGCLAVGRAALESEYHLKVAQSFELKQAIGRVTARLVKKGDILLINDGSTTFHLASHLGECGSLTVYTNSLAMISELSRFSEIKLYILGGEYIPEQYSLRGSLTEQVLESIHPDLVFLGADAIDEDGQCLVMTPEEARMTQVMLRSGSRTILLADHTKFGAKGYIAYGNLQDFDMWITTPGVSREKINEFKKKTQIMEADL
jgi:DeoR/GlpR family transcriptional regulator of sugar metabolism